MNHRITQRRRTRAVWSLFLASMLAGLLACGGGGVDENNSTEMMEESCASACGEGTTCQNGACVPVGTNNMTTPTNTGSNSTTPSE